MKFKQKFLLFFAFMGDVAVLYAALFSSLWIRLQFRRGYELVVSDHVIPFSLLFVVWLSVFYLFSLYDPRALKNNLRFMQRFGWALSINIAIAILFFYLLPIGGIAPKTILFIYLIVFTIYYFLWRGFYNRLLGNTLPSIKILLVGENEEIDELVTFIHNNPQVGYTIEKRVPSLTNEQTLTSAIEENGINLVIIPHEKKHDADLSKILVKNLRLGINVLDDATLYEMLLKKIPISAIRETWFIENFAQEERRVFDALARVFDVVFAIVLGVLFSPAILVIAPLIKLTSPGPVIYKQARVGKHEKEFTLYKFRSMVQNAEKNGPQWSSGKSDARVTGLGRVLRKTHLDELPQLVNILKGDLSIIGPRPERPTFVEKLQKEIPFYDLRHLVRPGFTGWAQINYRYGASVDDAYKKLQYDLYYIKNRSAALYIITMLKTARVFVSNPK